MTLDPPWDRLWLNARLATLRDGDGYGAIEDGAIATKGPYLAYVGPRAELTLTPREMAAEQVDCGRRWITPGLIDCHTHLIHAGDRSVEWEMRLEGASLEQIARAGGGIRATVQATRRASEQELAAGAAPRLRRLLAEGVTTIEIKSGYGLETEAELRMLRAARALEVAHPVTVRTSFLGAHAIPSEFDGRADAYLDLVIDEMLPRVAAEGLADAVDAFCEQFAFSHAQTQRLFRAAEKLGLPVRLHADQLSDSEGAALAAHYEALSADHLEYANEDGVAAMARAGTVAVLLPGTFFNLRERNLPPVHELRTHGARIALATDCNPASSPITSIQTAMNLACVLFRLTPREALAGVTREAAHALGLQATHGTLEVGKVADFCLWDIARPGEIAYGMGRNPLAAVVKEGVQVL